MCVANSMHKANSSKELSREGLDIVRRIADVLIHFNDIVERGSKRLKNQAIMVVVIQTLVVSNQMVFVFRVSSA